MGGAWMPILVALLVALAGAVGAVLYFQLRRPREDAGLSVALQNLTLALQETRAQTAIVAEKVSQMEPVKQIVSSIQLELRGLGERVATVEKNQSAVGQNVYQINEGLAKTSAAVENLLAATAAIRTELSRAQSDLRGLAERVATVEKNQSAVGQNVNQITEKLAKTSTAAENLLNATAAIRTELSRAQSELTELHTHAKAREEIHQRTADSIRRLEAIIAGTQTKGVAGENILDMIFAKLPPEWQVRNLRVGNKTVEFALRLPNNLLLPIDSKWAATNLMDQFVRTEDVQEKQRIKAQIESALIAKVREVRKYIDPALTVNFAIAAVPDAVYELCPGVQAESFRENVMLVSYSIFMPVLLLIFHTVLRTSQNVDLERLTTYLQTAENSLKELQEQLEGRFARALTMLSNTRDDMSVHLSKVSSALTNMQLSASAAKPVPLPVEAAELPPPSNPSAAS